MHEALVKKLSELFRDYVSQLNLTGYACGGYAKSINAPVLPHHSECVMFPDIIPRYTVEEYARACKRASQVGKISIKVNVSGSNGSAKG